MKTDLLTTYLSKLHEEFRQIHDGEVASYIPELSKADPDWFGIALVTVDGHVYQIGETRQPFTIQSISKVITHGIGLEDFGAQAIIEKVDVEPSGEAFNSISLEPETGRPRNPMINAGAIATTAFIKGNSLDEKLARLLGTYKKFTSHDVAIDQEVYESERDTGHRNRAIAYMLRNYNIIEKDTDELLDLYFRQCSILVNAKDLAMIAASLANKGVNPVTGVRAVGSEHVPKMLSVMSSCGMYDYSGAWIYDIGMPAKSGVAGGIMAVLPGQMGLAVFSPRLDDRGNSVRGIAVCKRISADFGLHMFHTGRTTATSVIHSTYDASSVTSKLSRNKAQSGILKSEGHKIMILELQGDLLFVSAEIVATESLKLAKESSYLIIDFRRIASISEGAMILLAHLQESLLEKNVTLFFTNLRDPHALTRAFRQRLPKISELHLLDFNDIDKALEWCENRLLADHQAEHPEEVPLKDQAICEGFSQQELSHLESFLNPVTFPKGYRICKSGDPADELFFILSGLVSVLVPVGYNRGSRITTITAGAVFGEMGLLDHGVRSADVVADTDIHAMVLRYDALGLDGSPLSREVLFKLISNIGRQLTYKLRQATDEIKSLKR